MELTPEAVAPIKRWDRSKEVARSGSWSADVAAASGPWEHARPMVVPQLPNDRWSLDFVSDQFVDGRRLRILVVVDDCTRECLAIVICCWADLAISPR